MLLKLDLNQTVGAACHELHTKLPTQAVQNPALALCSIY
jgi:hypothetical protein